MTKRNRWRWPREWLGFADKGDGEICEVTHLWNPAPFGSTEPCMWVTVRHPNGECCAHGAGVDDHLNNLRPLTPAARQLVAIARANGKAGR
jgi:hypothetical protein